MASKKRAGKKRAAEKRGRLAAQAVGMAVKRKPRATRATRWMGSKQLAKAVWAAMRPLIEQKVEELLRANAAGDVPPSPPQTPRASGGGGSGDQPRPSLPERPKFDPSNLQRAVVAIPLAEAIARTQRGESVPESVCYDAEAGLFPVIIDLSLGYPGGRERARHRVYDLLARILHGAPSHGRSAGQSSSRKAPQMRRWDQAVPERLRESSSQYVFANLAPREIQELVRQDNRWPKAERKAPSSDAMSSMRISPKRAIFRVWPSHPVAPQLIQSVCTIKGDAAVATFGASGSNVVWAVVDSGISGAHPHFELHQNLAALPDGVMHKDFTGGNEPAPLRDVFGHGSHVAGIIAGEHAGTASTMRYMRDDRDRSVATGGTVTKIRGVAPQCKLVSYKVLDDAGKGDVRNTIAALEDIARTNGDGRQIRIHGVNLSLGYPFDAKWFACGQSPLCEVVDRLVRQGVVVVVAAGNTGYASFDPIMAAGSWAQGVALSINDPGNAQMAITVGSTHREAPHRYGTSYFSSKGPTGDGRAKPDLLAPGERIISCNSLEWAKNAADGQVALYREESGTSMAAPHVSGAVAAFLSIRGEFIGRAEEVKRIFMNTATDLQRERYMQGAGLIDLLRALQSV